MRTCPVCHEELKRETYKGVSIDECQKGHGMFFDRGELTRAKDSADPELSFLDFDLFDTSADNQEDSGKKCPKDGREMVTVHYGNSHVKVDLCPDCRGIWLDKDEFAKIIAYLERFVQEQSLGDLTKLSQEEFKEIFTGDKKVGAEIHDFIAVTNLLETRYVSEHPGLWDFIFGYYKYTPFR